MMLASALVAWRVVMCYVLPSMLGCRACIVEVILASVLGCMACRRVRCLVFDATVGSKGCIVNVMLAWGARMLGMLSCALSLLGC